MVRPMTDDDLRIRKTTVTLADGRELMYFGAIPERPADYPDRRQLAEVHVRSQARWERLLGEWVVIASHRQDRTFQPADDQCRSAPPRRAAAPRSRPRSMRWSSSRTGFPHSGPRRRMPAAAMTVTRPGWPAQAARWPAGRPAAGARSSVSASITPPPS